MSPKLPTRKIGTTDVTAIGFGAMGVSAFYGATLPEEEGLKFLDAVYESGCTNWDTADVYGGSEELIGKWFKRTGKRDEIFLATKFGNTQGGIRGDKAYVREAAESSLKKLGVNQIDLYYLHRADSNTPIEHTVAAMAELVKEGKVKYLGLSEVSAENLRRAHKVHPISALQVEYSPFVLDIENPKIAVLQAARELGVTVVAYSPLGRGLLTGRYKGPEDFAEDDFRRIVPKFSKENFSLILKLVDDLKSVGAVHGASAAQVTLAWLLAQGDDIIPIPGTSNVKRLEENLGALKVQLSADEIAQVRKIAERADAIPGGRYPDFLMKTVFVDTPAP
ncbi:Aldo/keto reductase [Gloeopeniophorella convolvens]|nr:Aldo/keto reductase [Gloeopeniophorella convolvens]